MRNSRLLKKIINKNSVEELIQEFKKEYQAITNSFQTKNPETEKLIGYSFSKNKLTKKNLIIVVSFILLISWIIISQFLIENKTINLDQIIIDLPLPQKKTLLTRQSIFSEMEEKLTNNNDVQKYLEYIVNNNNFAFIFNSEFTQKYYNVDNMQVNKDYKEYKVVCPDGYEMKKLGGILEYEKKSKSN